MRIDVTKTFLPPLEEYTDLLKGIWEKGWITNHGELVNKLEYELNQKLNVENFLAVNNGTIALQIAIKSLELENEIITTPFSYVATTSSIVWQNCKPVFVDIEPETLCIDPAKIEDAISENTQAILATHVYGNPCDVLQIGKIAKKYQLKVIYDAAHAFGVNYKGESIFNYGNISTMSFHATKVFHTVEGGGIVCRDNKLHEKCAYMRNFGHNGQEKFFGLGINGKLSEFHAAMGIVNLRYVQNILSARKRVCDLYDLSLLEFRRPKIREGTEYNYAYYPLIMDSEEQLLAVLKKLRKNNIYPRRYFYPSLTELPYINLDSCPVARGISKKVICLPLYQSLSEDEVKGICSIINSVKTQSAG